MNTFENLRDKVHYLLDNQNYSGAEKALKGVALDFNNTAEENKLLIANTASLYIDLGSESRNSEYVQKGLDLYNENTEFFKGVITEESIKYCLANGYHALYKIAIPDDKWQIPTLQNVKDYLFQAKRNYLSAYKSIDPNQLNKFGFEVLTNLADNLNHSGRVVEAIQLFDTVLNENPEFPQAIVSKASGILFLRSITKFEFIPFPLVIETYLLLSSTPLDKIYNPEVRKRAYQELKACESLLTENGFDTNEILKDSFQSSLEFEKHPEEIKFYLSNFLSLSEHGIYCQCNGAREDDINYEYSSKQFIDPKLDFLRPLLGQIKSEYLMSRSLFYQYSKNTQVWEIEKLRTSFRLCFGILDKIAEGICFHFDVKDNPNENIYFESFWNSKSAKERWGKLNSIKNIHLSALYSIANDLHRANGEFAFYKEWRNQLEHGLLIVSENETENSNIVSINRGLFEHRTKHLLQLTRSAIFSFVFCIRDSLNKNHNPEN